MRPSQTAPTCLNQSCCSSTKPAWRTCRTGKVVCQRSGYSNCMLGRRKSRGMHPPCKRLSERLHLVLNNFHHFFTSVDKPLEAHTFWAVWLNGMLLEGASEDAVAGMSKVLIIPFEQSNNRKAELMDGRRVALCKKVCLSLKMLKSERNRY